VKACIFIGKRLEFRPDTGQKTSSPIGTISGFGVAKNRSMRLRCRFLNYFEALHPPLFIIQNYTWL